MNPVCSTPPHASSAPGHQLALAHLRLAYETPKGLTDVVHDLSLTLERGQIGCLLGASGCGKSTVLRAIAGFEPLRAGHISLFGRQLASASGHLPPERRHVGMMFQDYALFPHLTVAANVGFGLNRLGRAQRQARVLAMLELVGLQDTADRHPHELSGGQQQRVALARALAPAPDLLLLDEPFSNLDVNTREHLAVEVRNILKSTDHTAILVTHNQAEAFAIADRIGVMHEGRILQWDTPANLRDNPVNEFVARFLRNDFSADAAR